MTPTPPAGLGRAGQLFEIRDGDREAIVTQQGANLYKARWAGTDLLATVNDDGYTGGGGHGQLLLPWPNRIRNGVYEFEGEHYQLPITDRTHGSAIHGFTHWLTWEVKEHLADRVTLSCLLLAQPGYPFPLAFENSYHLRSGALEISTIATNIGGRTAPFGFGAHPYFKTGTAIVDDSVLQVQASSYFETNADLSPKVPAVPVDGSVFDFREPRPVGGTEFDVTLTDLARDEDARAKANFRLAGREHFDHVQIRRAHPVRADIHWRHVGVAPPRGLGHRALNLCARTRSTTASVSSISLPGVPSGFGGRWQLIRPCRAPRRPTSPEETWTVYAQKPS